MKKPVGWLSIRVPMGSQFNPPFTPLVRRAVHQVCDHLMDKWPVKSLRITMTPARYRRRPVYKGR